MEKLTIECVETYIKDGLHYGKIIAEPLERGSGITLGNSLRRVLLSDLEGTAVTAIKIEGVPHEFSVIDGVLEDVIELILNIKRIVLRTYTNDVKIIRLSVHEEGKVFAKHIITDADIEIVNPEWHIATLADGGHLEMEMMVKKGKGFVPAGKNDITNLPIGWIPIDAIYMPVRKVSYSVEDTRVGQVTNFDRLVLEVWTNGSIEPAKSVSIASQIVRDQLSLFTSLDGEILVEEGKEEVAGDGAPRIEDVTIEELELSVRSFNCLKRANIFNLGDLLKRTERELMEIKNFGRKSAEEVIDCLHKYGYQLKPGVKIKDE